MTNYEVFHLLNQKKRLLEKELNTVLKPFQLYTAQWAILYCLDRFGSMTQTDIWKYLHVKAPTVTRTLAKMEKNGWIYRKYGIDRRERVITLTNRAKQQLPKIKQQVKIVERKLLQHLSAAEMEQLNILLRKINEK